MRNLAETFTNKLIQLDIIKSEDKEIYYYGFWQGSIFVLNVLTVIIVGWLFHMLWQALLFTIAYGLIRTVAGGYHARTQVNCYIFSVVMIVSVLSILKYTPWNPIIYLIFVSIASICIFLFAPVEDANKPLDALEKKIYQKRARIFLALIFFFTLLFTLTVHKEIAHCLSLSIISVSFMLILGKLKS